MFVDNGIVHNIYIYIYIHTHHAYSLNDYIDGI